MQPYRVWLVQDLIEKNKRVFKTPVYQRNYDWRKDQCTKLYEDIISAFNNDRKHFLGTVVYIKGGENSSILDECLIIDGQQRITTIFILLRILFDFATDTQDSLVSELQDYLYNRNCDESLKLKLKPVKGDNDGFKKLMDGNIEKADPASNLARNYRLLYQQVLLSMKTGLTLRDILRGMKFLEIVEIILDTSQGDDPQTIFESINSTGLELSLADLVRNYLLMSDPNQDELFENYWLPMEQSVGYDNLAEFFIHYLNLKSSEKITTKNAYLQFKRFFEENNYSHETMLRELQMYASYYSAFIGREDTYSHEINYYLLAFRLLDQSTYYPFMFHIFEDHQNQKIDEKTLVKVLRFLRSYAVRRIVCEIPSNSLKGLFQTAYSRMFKQENDIVNYYDVIGTFLLTLKTKDRMPRDEEFVDSLKLKNLYSKKKMCKYLLATIENEGSHEKVETESMTIEHVLPQKENSAVWKKEMGEDYSRIFDTYLHTLGNLTITGHNSELGTRSFAEKKKIILNNSKANILNKQILSEDHWSENCIIKRAESLALLAVNYFDYENVSLINRAIESEDGKHFTLEDIGEVSHTTPYKFTFMGEMVAVKSHRDMLQKMMDLLFGLDPDCFDNLARVQYHPKSASHAYISFSATDLHSAGQISKTDIYFEKHLSAISIMMFIKRMIEECQLDTDDFVFYIE